MRTVRLSLVIVGVVVLGLLSTAAQVRLTTAAATAAANAVVDRVDAGSGPGTLVLYGAACPVTADDADSGTVLAVLPFPDPAFGSASNGTAGVTGGATLTDESANASGTAQCFRVKDSDGTTVWQGTVTVTGGGGDLALVTTTVAAGQPIALSPFTYTQPTSGEAVITWEHDGVNLTGFVLSIDGVETALGALAPTTGTTYQTAWPSGTAIGAHAVIIYALNGDERTASLTAVLTYGT